MYGVNRELIKPFLHPYSSFFHGHLNDLLFVPAVLPLYLYFYRCIGLRPDDEPPRFWASVIAALRTCLPTIGREALELLHSQDSPPLSAILALLLNELVKVDRDMVLILDDYHVIEDLAIHESLIFLLDHLPDTLHLVLSTRTDPELPLSRLRVRSQMVEIREGDLRFTEQETASFLLQRMGLSLSEETVAILEELGFTNIQYETAACQKK